MQVDTLICFVVVVASQWLLGHISFLLQPLNRLLGLKINVSIIVLGFNWVDSLLNGNMGKKTERDSVLDNQRHPMYKYIKLHQKCQKKNKKEGV